MQPTCLCSRDMSKDRAGNSSSSACRCRGGQPQCLQRVQQCWVRASAASWQSMAQLMTMMLSTSNISMMHLRMTKVMSRRV